MKNSNKILGFCFLLFVGQSLLAQNYFVDTYAGNGTIGNVDGITFNARFDRPSSICFDSLGNMFIADWGNNSVRKITPAGIVSTLAGNGTPGFSNGTGSAATFYQPSWLDIDKNTGDIYVVDVGNECIRKVTQTGVVTTFAGTGVAGYLDGPVASAQFNALAGMAIAPNGDIYISDRNNYRIRKISGGVVTTVAGDGTPGFADGPGLSARFNVPADIEIDNQGMVYIADRDNNRIRMYNPNTNMVSTYAGNGTASSIDGSLTTCSFNAPRGFYLTDNGDFYVADQNGNKIRMITGNNVTTIAGTGSTGYQDGPSQYAEFNLPWDVAYLQGTIYVAGDFDYSIRKIHKKFSPNEVDEIVNDSTSFNLILFPNPTNSNINLEISTSEINIAELTISIFDLSGKLLQSENYYDLSTGQIVSLSLITELYSQGLYLLVAKINNEAILSREFIFE